MKVEIAYKSWEVFCESGKLDVLNLGKGHNLSHSIFNDSSILLADDIAGLIKQKQNKNQTCLLGLNTRFNTIKVYEELVRMHKEEGLSFDNVEAFILEEYFPIDKLGIQSSHSLIYQHLFDHVDMHPEKVHFLDCKEYELKIKPKGGLDFHVPEPEELSQIDFNNLGSYLNLVKKHNTLNNIINLNPKHSILKNKKMKGKTTNLRIV